MKEYMYGYRLRPPSIGTQPKGFLRFGGKEHLSYWGYVIYDRKLTEKEVFEYDLELIGECKNGDK